MTRLAGYARTMDPLFEPGDSSESRPLKIPWIARAHVRRGSMRNERVDVE